MCFFVKTDKMASPQNDFCKKLSTYLGPRLAQISREITDFNAKNKSSQGYATVCFVVVLCSSFFFVFFCFFISFYCTNFFLHIRFVLWLLLFF